MPNVNVDKKVEIFYPEDELKELKKCLTLQGFLLEAKRHTGISTISIKKYAKEGRGQKGKIDSIRNYVQAFKQASTVIERGAA